MDKRLAIDVGGSSIKYALMGEDHQILEQGKVPAPREVKEEFIEAVGQLYDRYAEQISGMGISMAGKVNPHTGYVVSAGSFPFFTGTNMIESLAKRCPTHITVDNDARCAARAELYYGVLADAKNALVIVLGTGIGGAVIVNRQLLDGARFCAAELSFLRVGGQADVSDCWLWRGGAQGLCLMAKQALGTEDDIDGFKVFELADAGDERILAMLDEYARIAAVQIYNMQCLLDVEAVAIGGGISAREDLIDRIRTQLQAIFDAEAAYQIPPAMPRVVSCQFRNDANLIGAWYDNVNR